MFPVRSETRALRDSMLTSSESRGQWFLRACIVHLLPEPVQASCGAQLSSRYLATSFRYSPVFPID